MCVVYYSFSFSFRFGTVRFAFAISVYVEVFRLSIVPLPPAPPPLLSSLAFFSIFSSSKVKFPIDFCVVLFVLYTLFVFIMRIADTFGEKAKSKCQHHLTSRRNETTTTTPATLRRRNPLQSQQHFHRRLRSMRFRSLPNALWRTVPWPNWLRLQLLSSCLFLSCSSLTSSGVSSIVARCKLQLQSLFAVSFFIFESSSCTRSMESSASYSSRSRSPSSAPAATLACAASSLPASVPSAVPAISRCLRMSKFCFQRSISENRLRGSRLSTGRYPVAVRKYKKKLKFYTNYLQISFLMGIFSV